MPESSNPAIPPREALSPEAVEAFEERLIAEYTDAGLFTKVFDDPANEHSTPHAHEGATLVTLKGSAKVKLDEGEWQTVIPGDITVIKDQQMHEVITGKDGWTYLFACSQTEAKRQGLVS